MAKPSPCETCNYWQLCQDDPRANLSSWQHGTIIAREIIDDAQMQAELKEAYMEEEVDPRHIDEGVACAKRQLEGCQSDASSGDKVSVEAAATPRGDPNHEQFGYRLVSYLDGADMEVDILVSHGYTPEEDRLGSDATAIFPNIEKQTEGSGE